MIQIRKKDQARCEKRALWGGPSSRFIGIFQAARNELKRGFERRARYPQNKSAQGNCQELK